MRPSGFRVDLLPSLRLSAVCVLAGFLGGVACAVTFRDSVAYAAESRPDAEVVALRSQVASLEAALYASDGERCPNLGVYPVPPPAKRGKR